MAEAKAREASFDVLKGVAILAVVALHTSGFAARRFAADGSWLWWSLRIGNRLLSVAVPTFLLVSAVLLARGCARGPVDWRRFYRRRLEGLVWPLVVWTVLYWLFRLYVVGREADLRPVLVQTPCGPFEVAHLWADWPRRLRDLGLGKANYHLYFLSIVVQQALLLPVLVAGLRRGPKGFGLTLGVAVILQLAAFWLQRYVLRMPFPASTVPWYLVVLVPGVWLGLRWQQWPAIWLRNRNWLTLLATVLGVAFLVLVVRTLEGRPVDGMQMNVSEKLFTGVAALVALGWAGSWATGGPIAKSLEWFGRESLQIYLVHPMLLFFLSGPRIGSLIDRLPGSPALLFVLLVGLSALFAEGCRRLGLERAFFGRARPPQTV